MEFYYCSEPDLEYKGYYSSFVNKKLKNADAKFCDIRTYIRKNQKRWLNSIEEWHSTLCIIGSKITPFWWLIDGSRFYTWSPPIYSPFIYSIAVYQYCKEHKINHITLVDCPKEVYKYLNEIAPSAENFFQKNFENKYLNRFSNFKRIIKNLTNLSTQFLISFRYIFEFNYKNSFERKIIFSQIFDHIKENDSLDHFFGKIFDNHELNNENIILWLFEYNLNFKTKKFYKKKSLLKNKEYRFIQKLNTPLDIISILVIYVKLLNSYRIIAKKLPSIEIDGLKSKLLPREYFCFLVNGFLPLKELLIYNAFNKIIKFNNNLDTIIYPYEEKTIERAIILSARKNKSKITTIGYCHSVHWNLHYWYHIRKDPIANSPRPNIYLVTGPYEKYWLNKIAKVPKEKIKIIGSNRYVEKKYPFPESIFEKNILKILVTVGQASDMNILANYVEDQIDIFKQCHLLIRKYPFSWIIEQNAGISRIKNHVKNITISNTESLESQIEWSDIILYNSSSCGIIGMLSGRISINVALHDILYWDPFEKRGSKNSVIHCSSASELKKIIHNLRTLNSKRYEIIQKKQYSYAKNVYAPLEDDVIFELLSKNSFTKN